MTAFLTGGLTSIALATLMFFAMQGGTVLMQDRFDQPNLHLDHYALDE